MTFAVYLAAAHHLWLWVFPMPDIAPGQEWRVVLRLFLLILCQAAGWGLLACVGWARYGRK